MEPNANMEAYISALENVDLGVLDMIAESLRNQVEDEGGRIFIAGNGGSHAIAQHFASDLMKPVGSDDLCCSVECLSNNVALITALANDIGYDCIFAKQVEAAKLTDVDLVLAFSVSGTSPNIQALYEYTRAKHAWFYCITGRGEYEATAPFDVGGLEVQTSLHPDEPLHYYVCESVFSTIAHEIARLFHIKRGNYA